MGKVRRKATPRVPAPPARMEVQFETLRRAMILLQEGDWAGAEPLCRSFLRRQPEHQGALTLLGIILAQSGRPAEAGESFRRAVACTPQDPQAHSNYGNALRDCGRYQDALACYERALQLEPRRAETHYCRAVTLQAIGESARAVESYDEALRLQPNHAAAWNNRGTVLRHLGRLESALLSYDRAIEARPDHADAHNNRGATLHELQRLDEALSSYERALQLQPGHLETLNNLGVTLYQLGRHEEALAHIDRVLALRPEYAGALNNRGLVLHKLERYDEAIECFRRAHALAPNDPAPLSNLGVTLKTLGRHEDALASYARALEKEPAFADAHFNLAVALRDLRRFPEALASIEQALACGRTDAEAYRNHGATLMTLRCPEEAIGSYECALQRDPKAKFLRGEQRHARMKICDWRNFDVDVNEISAGVPRGEALVTPFALLALVDSPGLQRRAAEILVREDYQPLRQLPIVKAYPKHDKIRVGYFSADLRNHAVAALSAELFELHDRSKFELTAFSLDSDPGDELRVRIEGAFDRFLSLGGRTDEDIARLARDLEIDIAVDLGGYTQGARPRIMALRPAPVQVSYLGYLGTMGADFIDYLIADPILIPKECREHYIEKIAYLPSYQVNDSKRPAPEGPATRAAFGLPERGFVFCCFNASFKIVPRMFDSWMRILAAVPDSVLFLLAATAATARNLRLQAQRRGIDPRRLFFGEPLPYGQYLGRFQAADLFLDTLPYSAGTTASDALWANLPVLTCRGTAFAARMAASVLTSAGLPELIANDPEEYERRAVELATDVHQIAMIRRRLAEGLAHSALFDTAAFTRNLETLYTAMHQRCCAGWLPEDLSVHEVQELQPSRVYAQPQS